MAFELNRIQVIGRLGRDPEMRFTPQGTAITNFSVAVGGKWTDRDGNERGDDTEWFRVDVWGPRGGGENNGLAGLCNQYLNKGQQVYVEGRLKTEQWTDRDGNPRTTVKIVANNVVFLGSKSERTGGNELHDPDEEYEAPPQGRAAPARGASQGGGRNQPRPVEGDMNDDEIPF